MTKNLKLKAARAAMDPAQEQLTEKASVARQTTNVIEKGDYDPGMNLCVTIYRVLGRTLDDLFWEKQRL